MEMSFDLNFKCGEICPNTANIFYRVHNPSLITDKINLSCFIFAYRMTLNIVYFFLFVHLHKSLAQKPNPMLYGSRTYYNSRFLSTLAGRIHRKHV